MKSNTSPVQLRLERWLQAILHSENPSESLIAFRFGLSEVEEGYLLYLAGSENHDELDSEWAATPPEFLAKEELLVADEEVEDWNEMLEIMVNFLKTKLNTTQVEASFLGGNIPVYTGFIDGDLYRIK